jgi:predicted RNA binding protein YcfA (HicA-like mRNA interferase family)
MAKKYREVRAALRQSGWTLARESGSHETWRHPDGRRVTVAGKDSTTVPAGTLASIRRATGLDELR